MFKKNSNSKTSENYSIYNDPKVNEEWDKRIKGNSKEIHNKDKDETIYDNENTLEKSRRRKDELGEIISKKGGLNELSSFFAKKKGVSDRMSEDIEDTDTLYGWARSQVFKKNKGGKPIATRGKKGTGKAKTAKAKKPVVKKKTTKATKKKKN